MRNSAKDTEWQNSSSWQVDSVCSVWLVYLSQHRFVLTTQSTVELPDIQRNKNTGKAAADIAANSQTQKQPR